MEEEGRDEKGRFKRGNLFSIGNNGGQPPIYTDPNVLANKIAEYLDWEDENRALTAKKQGNGIYTIEGCALFLGFATRESFYDYEKRTPEFFYVLNRFRLFMTHWNAQKLYNGVSFAGSQFWLKNWGGYKDESEQNINQTVTTVTPTIVDTGVPLSNNEKDIKE